MDLSDRVAVLREGRLQQVASPRALYDRPANAFVAGFVGESNLLDGVVVSVDGEQALVEIAGGRACRRRAATFGSGDRVRVLLRPDAAELSAEGAAEGDGLAGIVEEVADPGRPAGPHPPGRRRAPHGDATPSRGRARPPTRRSGRTALAVGRRSPPCPRALTASDARLPVPRHGAAPAPSGSVSWALVVLTDSEACHRVAPGEDPLWTHLSPVHQGGRDVGGRRLAAAQTLALIGLGSPARPGGRGGAGRDPRRCVALSRPSPRRGGARRGPADARASVGVRVPGDRAWLALRFTVARRIVTLPAAPHRRVARCARLRAPGPSAVAHRSSVARCQGERTKSGRALALVVRGCADGGVRHGARAGQAAGSHAGERDSLSQILEPLLTAAGLARPRRPAARPRSPSWKGSRSSSS